MTRRVTLHIDRLTLRSIAEADSAAIARSLQTELRRLLAEPERLQVFLDSGNRHRVTAGSVRLAMSRKDTIGKAVARQLLRGIRQ